MPPRTLARAQVDLIRDQATLTTVRALLMAAVPWATVHECSHGQLPLPLLLGVDFHRNEAATGAASHEARVVGSRTGTFQTRADSGRPRLERPSIATAAAGGETFAGSAANTVPSWVSSGAGSAVHSYKTLEFVSDTPLRLAAFQDLIAALSSSGGDGGAATRPAPPNLVAAPTRQRRNDDEKEAEVVVEEEAEAEAARAEGVVSSGCAGLLSRAVRVKGVVWFAECRADRWLFQLSGRQRVSLEHDGAWTSRPRIELVVIWRASENQVERLRAALEAMRVPGAGDVAPKAAVAAPQQVAAAEVTQAAALTDALLCNVCEEPPPARACSEQPVSASDTVEEAHTSEAERVRSILRADPRFEVVEVPLIVPNTQSTPEAKATEGTLEDSRVTSEAGRPCKRARPDAAVPAVTSCSLAATTSTIAAERLAARLVHFQLVGAVLCGLTRLQFERVHGVDIDELNATFIRRLNAALVSEWTPCRYFEADRAAAFTPIAGNAVAAAAVVPNSDGAVGGMIWQPKPCLTGAPQTKAGAILQPRFTARFAVGGRCRFDHVWPVISRVAEDLLMQTFARLKLCRCDH